MAVLSHSATYPHHTISLPTNCSLRLNMADSGLQVNCCDILFGGPMNGRHIERRSILIGNMRPECRLIASGWEKLFPISHIIKRPYSDSRLAVLLLEDCMYVWEGWQDSTFRNFYWRHVPEHYEFTIRHLLALQT